MAISQQRLVQSTACLLLGQGFWGWQIEQRHFFGAFAALAKFAPYKCHYYYYYYYYFWLYEIQDGGRQIF